MKVDQKDLLMLESIYDGLCSKSQLAELLGVSEKTVENRAKKLSSLIKYSKKLGAYIYRDLLPALLPPKVVFKHIFNEIENAALESEFKELFKRYFCQQNELIKSSELSNTLAKIIVLTHAANTGVALACKYKNERKIIRVSRLINCSTMRYAHVRYDEKNRQNCGEFRTLALNFISDISATTSKRQITVCKEAGNAWGLLAHKSCTRLRLIDNAAVFFKRESPKSYNYRFISEDDDGVLIDFYYTPNSAELARFVASWLGLVKVLDEELNAQISKQITNSFNSQDAFKSASTKPGS